MRLWRIAGQLMALGLVLSGCGLPTKMAHKAEGTLLPGPIGTDQAEAQRLIQSGAPRVAVTMLDRGDGFLMVKAGERDGVSRWRSIDNVQLYTRGGLLIGTRGLGGDDLMTADPGGVLALALAGQAGQIRRIETHLDGDRQTAVGRFSCAVTPKGPSNVPVPEGPARVANRLDEICQPDPATRAAGAKAFANTYWILDGRVLQTVQHISDKVGRAQILYIP